MDTIDGRNTKEADTYDINANKLCYIINNEEFDKGLNLSTRSGTAKDFEQLKKLFKKLGFVVSNHKNCSSRDIYDNLRKLSQDKQLTDISLFVCIILTHGTEGTIFGTDGPVDLDRLFSYFKGDRCKALVGKPKVFFIQACRGEKYDKGVYSDAIISNNINKIPIEADFLIGYSTVPGYFSWRNGVNGSWYIQGLCDELEKTDKNQDILQVLVRVNNNVASKFQSHTGVSSTDGMVQIPSFVCMLRKKLCFLPQSN